jgi:hypothetical protein
MFSVTWGVARVTFAYAPHNLDTLYLLLISVLRTMYDVCVNQRERVHTLILSEKPGWMCILIDFAVWFLKIDTVYPSAVLRRRTIFQLLRNLLWDGLVRWPCAPGRDRAAFVRASYRPGRESSAALILFRCYLAHEALLPYLSNEPTWLHLLGAWIENESCMDMVLPALTQLHTASASCYESTCVFVRRLVHTQAVLSFPVDLSQSVATSMSSTLRIIQERIRMIQTKDRHEFFVLFRCLEQTLQLTHSLFLSCQPTTMGESDRETLCGLVDFFAPRILIKPEGYATDECDEAPLARCIVHCLLQLPLPENESARLLQLVRARLDRLASDKTPALLRMCQNLACHTLNQERAQTNADILSQSTACLEESQATIPSPRQNEYSDENDDDDDDDDDDEDDDDEDDEDYIYEGVSESDSEEEKDEEDIVDVHEADEVYEASKHVPSEQELDLLRRKLRRVHALEPNDDEDDTDRPKKKPRHASPTDHMNDQDVEIIRLVLSHITCLDDNNVVFNANHPAGLRVGPSDLVTGQQGLFAGGAMTADSTITWYTGQTYVGTGKTADRRQAQCVSESSAAAAAAVSPLSSADYFLDVTEDNCVKYIINGFVPDARFGGQKRCVGTYINHHETKANTEFRIRKVSNQRGVLVYRVAVMALRDIAAHEELLIDYGHDFSTKLRASGHMRV